jgi:hypothetical protein
MSGNIEIRKLAELACGTSKDSPEYKRFLEAMNPTLLLDLTAAPVVERQPVSADIAHDKAYRNGMMAGFSFGIRGDEDGYAKAVERYDDEINAAKAEQPAPVAADERAEFENHYRDRIMGNRTGVRFLRSASGSYLDSEVREMWSGWQARACLDKLKELNQ